jgi:hypothetical protein
LLNDDRFGWAGRCHLPKDIFVDCVRIEQLRLEEVALPPLQSGRGKSDAGSGADTPAPIDDDPHCHDTPALIAYSIASVSDATPSLVSRAATSSAVARFCADPEVMALSTSNSEPSNSDVPWSEPKSEISNPTNFALIAVITQPLNNMMYNFFVLHFSFQIFSAP